jgi:diguanylate cyclase (GGDEF)-like protein
MLPPEAPAARVSDLQDAALNCYLSSLLAMAKSMSAICSRAGLIHGARLTRLPRRLGFEATSEALEKSCHVLEDELADYTEATSHWLDAGSSLAREIVTIIQALDLHTDDSPDLHAAMLEDLAAHMVVSAEVETDLRGALKRYALGLRSYLQKRHLESRSSLKDLQCRAERLAEWLQRADPSNCTDLATGLPHRREMERQLELCWHIPKPVSVLLFDWQAANSATPQAVADAIARQLADRLADLVRPRDMVGRWGPNQFAVIFECSGKDAVQRAGRIAEWLTDNYLALQDGDVATIHVGVTVSVIERLPDETVAQLIQRIEQLQPAQAAVLGNV